MASTGSSSSVAAPEPSPSAQAELVVGLTSFNDAATIGPVVAALRAGVQEHFGGGASRLVLADGGSSDDTVRRARVAFEGAGDLVELVVEVPQATMPYHGMPGRARALAGILGAARDLGARACAVVDASVVSVAPHWVRLLAEPVLRHDADFVSPHYRRHAYEGALTKSIVYPVMRALYGVQLHQPAAGEFACSARLVDALLAEDFWDADGAAAGVDVWLTAAAATGDFRLAETALGERAHRSRGEPLDLPTTVAQVIGSLFGAVDRHANAWQRVRTSRPVPHFGEPPAGSTVPAPPVDVERLMESFRLGYRELREIWTWVLPPKTIVELKKLADAPSDRFRLDDDLWARTVYDFTLGYRMRVLPRDHLLRSLVPLYLGWWASYILQVRHATAGDADQRVEQLAAAFEAQKPYLIARWRWPERLRT